MAFISLDDSNSLVVYDCYKQKKLVSDMGGQWDSVNKTWRVVFTMANLEALIDGFDTVGIDDSVEEAAIGQAAKEARLMKLRKMSKDDVPVRLKVPGMNGSPYNYQKLGVMYAVINGVGVLNADEMGLGKTIQAIATALMLKGQGKAENALIITPASLKFNWPLEIEKFTDEKYVIVDGSPDERVAQWLRDDVFFYVVNSELLLEDLFGGREYKRKEGETPEQTVKRKARIAKAKARERILGPVRRRMWDFIAVDEAQMLKSHSSKRSRNVKQLRGKFKMALTGTPMDGRLEELHSVMGFVAPGLLGSKMRFFQRHVETDFYGKVTGYKRLSEVTEKIQPFFIRRLKRDVLEDLPDKIYENRVVLLSKKEADIYDSLASNGHEVTEDAEAVVAIIRCKQFCNWPSMIDDDCSKSSKMDAFKEVLDEVVVQNGHKALVFSQYKETLDIIADNVSAMGLTYLRIDGDVDKKIRAEYQKKFNTDSSIDLMIGTEAMSTGLNFTSADYVLNYDDNWAPAIMAQREDRAHRIGQKNVVTVVNFVCKNTIEERIRKVIYDKSKVSATVLGDDTDEMVLKRLGPKDMAKLL